MAQLITTLALLTLTSASSRHVPASSGSAIPRRHSSQTKRRRAARR